MEVQKVKRRQRQDFLLFLLGLYNTFAISFVLRSLSSFFFLGTISFHYNFILKQTPFTMQEKSVLKPNLKFLFPPLAENYRYDYLPLDIHRLRSNRIFRSMTRERGERSRLRGQEDKAGTIGAAAK